MAEDKTIRLKKVMTDFNLGFSTIKDFLAKRKYEVDTPNVKISEEAYQWVAKEFGNELLVKRQADEIGALRRPKDTLVEPVVMPLEDSRVVEKPSVVVPKVEASVVVEVETGVELSVEEQRRERKRQRDRERRERLRNEKMEAEEVEQAQIDKGKAAWSEFLQPYEGKKKGKEDLVVEAAPVLEKIKIEVKPPQMPMIKGKIDLDGVGEETPKRGNWIADDAAEQERKRLKKQKDRDRKKRRKEEKAMEQRTGEHSRQVPAAVPPPMSREERAALAKEKLSGIYTKKDKSKQALSDAPDEPTLAERSAAEFIPTSAGVLSGPKVLDKIDLAKIPGTRPDRVDKSPAAKQDGASVQRGKRKRIKGGAVAIGSKDSKDKDGKRAPRPPFDKNKKPVQAVGEKRVRRKKRPMINEEEVQQKLKETLAKMMEKGAKTKTARYRRDKRDAAGERLMAEREAHSMDLKTLELTEFVTASDLSKMMEVQINAVIGACMNLGFMVSLNQRLDAEAIALIVENFGYKAVFVAPETKDVVDDEVDLPQDLLPRAPIVTVMGHVDHGKTSLIDNIRKTNVIAGEAGGITQHIGAYHVDLPSGRQITFLDTPGHEAFTAMRARGAQATDVAIIIVAADDSVMPQTIEAINHAVAAGVPMIFAINKIDKQGAAPEKIREQLAAMNYLVEDWGGKYQVQEIAAKAGLNVDKLLEKILVETDLLELKANPKRRAKGVVIESLLDKGRGYISRVLVQNGTLRAGDVILSGQHVGKIKAMFNERGKKIKEAGPSVPVEILGLNGATTAGDAFLVMEDERQARSIASQREQLQRIQGLRTQKHITLDEIGRRIAIGNFKELNLIVKADVDGSKEALTDSLLKLSTEQVQVQVKHSGVGAISESDVQLAIATESIIVCFQVRPSPAVRKMAEQEGIDIRLYSVIYDAIDEIKAAILGMHAPEYKENVVCVVEVMQVYHITKVGAVAGCIVRDGKIARQTKLRVIRAGIVIHTGRLDSLKRFKDDVKEVGTGFECGLSIAGFGDIEAGDFIEGYEEVQV